jgi:hypothetical protein
MDEAKAAGARPLDAETRRFKVRTFGASARETPRRMLPLGAIGPVDTIARMPWAAGNGRPDGARTPTLDADRLNAYRPGAAPAETLGAEPENTEQLQDVAMFDRWADELELAAEQAGIDLDP